LKTAVVTAVERLRHGGEEERVGACEALGQVPVEEARAAIPDLVIASKDRGPIVRRAAVDALKRIGLRSEDVLSALLDVLEDEDAVVRTEAALALGMLARDPGPAPAAPIGALTDRCAEVREAAAVALGMIAPRGERAVTALVQALEDEDERVRHAAGFALSSINDSTSKKAESLRH
jgi:HEAT repeat protein